jgi:hypothetical protein
MNNNYKKQSVKILGFALVALALSFQAKAQNTTTTGAGISNATVIQNAAVATVPVVDGAVRLVDNKGTIKYLQVKNGITALTNKSSDGRGVTTTWQLGGTLTDNTFINVDGKAFALNGLELVTSAAASINATTLSSNGTGTGWTVLIRDEATGATQKIKASDLLQVQAGQNVSEATAATYEFTIPANVPSEISKISVYRNGAKLVADTDYKYVSATGKVTLDPAATAYGEWALYVGDVIEIQWVK